MSTLDEVRILAQIDGPNYLVLRDALLQRGLGKADQAVRWRRDPDWRVALVAAALQGWTERQALYQAVKAEVEHAEPTPGALPRAGGAAGVWDRLESRAHADWGPPVLPLAWEQALKLGMGQPPARTAGWLAVMRGVPHEASVEPVAQLLEQAQDRLVRDRAAYTLAALPRDAVDKRLERMAAKAAELTEAVKVVRDLRR